MYATTWTTLTPAGETSTLDVQHNSDLDALVFYNQALQGIEPLPVPIEPGTYLFAQATLDGAVLGAQWHHVDEECKLTEITFDELLEQLTTYLCDEIAAALQ